MVVSDTIVKHNLWWKHGEAFDSHDRHLKEYKESEVQFERRDIELKNGIYVIIGPRQIGKTVWTKKRILNLLERGKVDPRSIFYFSCDALTSRGRKELRRIIDFFLKTSREFEKTYIFLDEINYVEDWAYEIKMLADTGAFSKSALILTGSSASEIRRKTELLPGRGIEGNTYFLKPLSFREFVLQTGGKFSQFIKDAEMKDSFNILSNKLKNISLDNMDLNQIEGKIMDILPFKSELDYLFNIYLLTVVFPMLINNYLQNKMKNIDDEVYETFIRIIKGDFANIRKQETTARQILSGILKRLTTRYSYTRLGKETEEGITHPTIIDYIELFEKSFIIRTLNCYDFAKKNIRPKAPKKIYFADPFIYYSVNNWIRGEGFDAAKEIIMKDKETSLIIEQIVAAHLAKLKEKPLTRESNTYLWYYYDRRKELDFIFKIKENDYLGVELKYQYNPSPSEILKIGDVRNYIVLTKDEMKTDENILFIPTSLFLALLKVSDRNL